MACSLVNRHTDRQTHRQTEKAKKEGTIPRDELGRLSLEYAFQYTILVRPAKKKVYRYVSYVVMSLCRDISTQWGTLSSFVVNVVSSFFNRIH